MTSIDPTGDETIGHLYDRMQPGVAYPIAGTGWTVQRAPSADYAQGGVLAEPASMVERDVDEQTIPARPAGDDVYRAAANNSAKPTAPSPKRQPTPPPPKPTPSSPKSSPKDDTATSAASSANSPPTETSTASSPKSAPNNARPTSPPHAGKPPRAHPAHTKCPAATCHIQSAANRGASAADENRQPKRREPIDQ